MTTKTCCFCVPLPTCSLGIGIFFICFFFCEMAFLGQRGIFIYSKADIWDYVQSAILTVGIISCIILICGVYKRCAFLFWVIIFAIIFILYMAMFIIDLVVYKYILTGILLQLAIIIILAISIMVVYTNYTHLKNEDL
ncbi:PREDICTED: uncharacterized protein LOC108616963 isoform X2 [Drosophila arizonae]|uniref:Uncharacterized protein LOC108616963 isoform X2 n=1 Tax=Drosophila arizonae TaxID=7263 RepID=A0ABM1PLA8_DROAR|nr:PREDICTED: uncharacterized protein LOC108616963 isoform X2 [Drosophila arizonae]